MKTRTRNITSSFASVLAAAAICSTALAGPQDTNFFVQVDINGAGGPNLAGWTNWDIVTGSANVFTNTANGVTTVLTVVNAGNTLPNSRNRSGPDGGDDAFFSNMYRDFIYNPHSASPIGWGMDFFKFEFSGLSANTNYEFTFYTYDQNIDAPRESKYMVWGIVDPTNYLIGISYNNGYAPGDREHRPPIITRNHMGGPWPSDGTVNDAYYYCGSVIATTDGGGNATIYGWNDSDVYTGTQHAPINGFTISGPTTNQNPTVLTNDITTVNNPVPTSYGPPTIWPYTAGIAIPTDGAYADEAFGDTNTMMGETFLATRDFSLRNFYFALNGSTNSGTYLLYLCDLGTGTPPASFNPSTYVNLLSHPELVWPNYWGFRPLNLTNKTIVKFKLGSSDQVVLTNAHYYFLGFQYAGGGSNDMVLARTTSGQTYANGSAYKGIATNVNNNLGSLRNFIMAVEAPNPNLAISVTRADYATTWPGSPVIKYPESVMSAYDLTDHTSPYGVLEGVPNGRAISMSFIATSDFNFGGVTLMCRGQGSTNCLFTLALYDVTNTFFTVTNTIEKWPRNFEPRWDSDPKGIPVFGTNLDFYYTGSATGTGTNDQFLILTVGNPAYQAPIKSGHSYVLELTADTLGQNANTDGLFQWVRDIGQGDFQIELFPDLNDGIQFDGYRTNDASGGTAYLILPRALSRTYTDPEQYAGMVAGNPRYFVTAVYAAPAVPSQPPYNITGQSVGAGGFTITWNSVIGRGYSVVRKTNLDDASWTIVATNYPPTGATSTTTSFTDTSAGPNQSFYRVTSP